MDLGDPGSMDLGDRWIDPPIRWIDGSRAEVVGAKLQQPPRTHMPIVLLQVTRLTSMLRVELDWIRTVYRHDEILGLRYCMDRMSQLVHVMLAG